MKEIDSLQSLRNAIVYVNRNGYVANPNYNPFSYPWGTGRFYFNPIPTQGRFADLSYRDKRSIFRSSVMDLPADWDMIDGYVAPPSYCKLAFGMSLFGNSQRYFMKVSKSVESYAGVAVEIDDGEFLTDAELFEQLVQFVKKEYNTTMLRDLSKAQKLDLARTLRNTYRSSNGQISRVIGLPLYEVNTLFPLSAR